MKIGSKEAQLRALKAAFDYREKGRGAPQAREAQEQSGGVSAVQAAQASEGIEDGEAERSEGSDGGGGESPGAQIVRGMEEAVAHAKGKRTHVRVTKIRVETYAPVGVCAFCDARRKQERDRVAQWRDNRKKRP